MNLKKLFLIFFSFIINLNLNSSDGSLDTTFNPGGSQPGTVTTNVGTNSLGNAVVIQSDGKIIVAGRGGTSVFCLVRYNTDGSLDTSFGSGGIVLTTIGFSGSINAMKLQSDGKIVVGGFSTFGGGMIPFTTARYNTNGTLDTTFNPAGPMPGVVTTNIGSGGMSQIFGLAIQIDGKIVVGGNAFIGGATRFAAARYNSDGSLDTTFNSGGSLPGTVTTTIGTSDSANSLLLQSDGKIVLGGSALIAGLRDFALVRYNSNGSLDTSFNTTGIVTTDLGGSFDSIVGITSQTDGKIVVAGASNAVGTGDFALARYNSNGTLDTTSFNPSGTGSIPGTILTSFRSGNDIARSVIIQEDGKILAAGGASESMGVFNFALARYNTDGSLDPSFGTVGLVETSFGSGTNDIANGIALQLDSKIVLAGTAAPLFAVARYNNTPPFITITSPVNGSTITNSQPIISGNTNAGLTVIVTIKNSSNVTVFSGAVNANVTTGAWSLPIEPTTLTDGTYTVTADIMGASATNTFTVDTSTFVTISFPVNGSTINNATPTILGTSEAGNTVEVFIDGSSIGTTTATGGNWQKVSPFLSEGAHTVQATATDAFGHTASTPIINFSVDTATFISITSPTNGSTITTATPTITGVAESNSTITVFIDGNSIGTTTSNGGNWSKAVTVPLSQGSHTVQATVTDQQGNTATTPLINFTVDTATFVTITSPENNSTINNAKPLITGTSEVNNNIEIKIDNVVIGTTTTSANGIWSFQTTNTLSETNHVLVVTATDAVGNTATATSNFTIDTTNFVTITFPENNSIIASRTPNITGTTQAGSSVEVSVDGISRGTSSAVNGTWSVQITTQLSDGQHTVKATSTDSSGNIATTTNTFTISTSTFVTITNPANGSTISNFTPMTFGKTVAGNEVRVFIDNVQIGIVIADVNGNWTINTPQPLSQGNHQARAVATDSLGHTATAISNFTIDASTFINVTTIKNNQVLRNNRPVVAGTAENGATVRVLIDNKLIGTAIVDESGWSIKVKNPLTNGRHTLIAIATDAAGNTAQVTLTFFVRVEVRRCTKGADALTLAIRRKYSSASVFLN